MKDCCSHCCFQIEGLSVTIDRRRILDNVNIHINCGELLAVVGPNGAGKTTLLKAILGEVAWRGSIRFRARGQQRDSAPRIGYVPQKLAFDADSPVSVCDLVASSLGARPVWMGVRGALKARVTGVLRKVQADHLCKRRIGELSGGELQRVLLAMALEPLPDVFLLDEPVTGIDAKGIALFYAIVDNLRREYDCSVIMVTHDLADIAPRADRMIVLNKTIVKEGPPREVMADPAMAKHLGYICRVEG